MARTGQPAARLVAAVERAVTVLEVLAESDADLGTNAIARRAGINASSVSRLLATLARAGLVEHQAATGRYRLGLRLFYLGNAAMARVDLRTRVRPELQALAETSGETATLCVPGGPSLPASGRSDDQDALTLDFVQSARSVQSVARLGRPSVGHATAIGKVLLAYRATAPSGPLTAYTERTITDPGALQEELERTAKRGWAQAVREREPDLNAVAVPLLRGDELVAILGLQGPAGRFGATAMRSAVELLQASTARIAGLKPDAPESPDTA